MQCDECGGTVVHTIPVYANGIGRICLSCLYPGEVHDGLPVPIAGLTDEQITAAWDRWEVERARM